MILEQAEYEALPKPDFKPPPVIPKEGYGEGTNQNVYFVCNDGMCSFQFLYHENRSNGYVF